MGIILSLPDGQQEENNDSDFSHPHRRTRKGKGETKLKELCAAVLLAGVFCGFASLFVMRPASRPRVQLRSSLWEQASQRRLPVWQSVGGRRKELSGRGGPARLWRIECAEVGGFGVQRSAIHECLRDRFEAGYKEFSKGAIWR